MGEINLLADIPVGDGPKRSHIHMRHALSRIARRVAAKALTSGREDVLLEVYCAGIAHATALLSAARTQSQGEGWEPIETAPSDTPVLVVTAQGRIFKAIYKPGIAENEQGSCGAWCTVDEADPHPDCWTDGMCWASNEDGMPSDQPVGWLPAPPASQTTHNERSPHDR